jgi:nitrogen fixation NifU-like protein
MNDYERIIEIYKQPKNMHVLLQKTSSGSAKNPNCGDDITFDIFAQDGRISDVSFHGTGCALSIASASLLTEKVKGMPVADAKALHDSDIFALVGESVAKGPGRRKCALLSLHALRKALA